MKMQPSSLSRHSRFVLISIILLQLSACISVTPVTPGVLATVNAKHLVNKNYTVGQKMTVNVGDPVIKFQDYWVDTAEAPVATPERTVNLKGGLISFTLEAGRRYPIRGNIQLEGADYAIAALSDDPNTYDAVLIRKDGTLLNRRGTNIGGRGVIVPSYELTVSDPSVRMLRESTDNVVSAKGYENYEILYTGTNASGLNLTYREFSPEGLARVAFYQNLTYEAGAKSITFKKYRISVDSATSESITYVVAADGE